MTGGHRSKRALKFSVVNDQKLILPTHSHIE
jgi:hypothetical protein